MENPAVPSLQVLALNLPDNLVQKRKPKTEVADYGHDIVDRVNSVSGGRST
jgi:hypothetical protein